MKCPKQAKLGTDVALALLTDGKEEGWYENLLITQENGHDNCLWNKGVEDEIH